MQTYYYLRNTFCSKKKYFEAMSLIVNCPASAYAFSGAEK
jgi:hypothetical protein